MLFKNGFPGKRWDFSNRYKNNGRILIKGAYYLHSVLHTAWNCNSKQIGLSLGK
jgi:hypothetical protein